MKKILAILLVLTLVYSCSTSSNDQSNSTTVVPLAPTNLTGTANTTQINLFWTDNSTNENEFKIERKTGSGTYVIVGTTGVDIATYSDNGLTPSTTYTYRVYSNNAVGKSLTYSNELSITTTNTSSINLTTTAVSSIANTTAVSGGAISSDGGATITAKGVCWSTSANPTIALNTKTNDGSGTGSFTSAISGLIPNTTYYVRAYATNSNSTAYGNQVSFTTTTPLGTIPVLTTQSITSITTLSSSCIRKNGITEPHRNGCQK
jgi:hypothetical protein